MDTEPRVIDQFKGIYEFLSNFYPHPITVEGVDFPSSEHAYQAMKTLDLDERRRIAALSTPGKAKAAGKKVKLRDGWNEMRVGVMAAILAIKFNVNSPLAQKLLDTGDAELIEGNTWNDRFFGVCRGKGQNKLGIILMNIRAMLRELPEETK